MSTTKKNGPDLVLLVSVDQMRYDYLTRFGVLFNGAFKTLTDHGFSYRRALYRHSATYTAPGHAVLGTGAHPRTSGIVGNRWFDRRTGTVVTAARPHLTATRGGYEVSPRYLLVSSVGDELRRATEKNKTVSRTVSVSGKDRAAILMGGHLTEAAYWYRGDDVTGTEVFESSPYYRGALAQQIERTKLPYAGLGDVDLPALRGHFRDKVKMWERLADVRAPDGKAVSYDDYARADRFPWEYKGGAFPHSIAGSGTGEAIEWSPYIDDLTAEFVKRAIIVHDLGAAESPELMTMSFSGVDKVGHIYGPWSHECMDTMLRLDRVLGNLLSWLEQRGLRVLTVLSADHGVAPIPEFSFPLQTASARRLTASFEAGVLDRIERQAGRQLLRKISKVQPTNPDEGQYVAAGGFYIDLQEVARAGLGREQAEEFARDAIEKDSIVSRVFTRSDLMGDEDAGDPFQWLFRNSFHDQRSPDLLVMLKHGHLVLDFAMGTSHGMPYEYDRHVPLILHGPGVKRGKASAPVGPEDIAPTLAHILGISGFPAEPGSGPLAAALVDPPQARKKSSS